MTTPPRRVRRRRTGSSSRRYQPSQLVQVTGQPRISREAVLTAIAVAIVAAALIALIWIVAIRSTEETTTHVREEAERNLVAQAATLAEKVKLELLIVDQSLTILQALWAENPETFRLADWHSRVPALTAVADDLFIADENRVIEQDILPQAVGQGIGAAYLPFPHGSLELFGPKGEPIRETRVITPAASATLEARRYLIYLVRPLGNPPKRLIGASFRSGEFTRHLAEASLGPNGIVGMLDQKAGFLQAVAGASARRPRTNLARTEMYEAMRRGDGGVWTGPTGVDGTPRIHGWAKVPGRDSVVFVAIPTHQAMAPAQVLVDATRAIAAVATGVVIAVGILVTWILATLRANRRRQRAHDRAVADAATAQAELAANRLRTATATQQVRALLDGISEGAAAFDAELRLSVWNDRFQAASGLPEDVLREGLPLDEFLRLQCRAGVITAEGDPETEIARRVQQLGLADAASPLTQRGPAGTPIPVLSRRMPDGGIVMILGGLAAWQPPPRPATAPAAPDAGPTPEGTANPVEW